MKRRKINCYHCLFKSLDIMRGRSRNVFQGASGTYFCLLRVGVSKSYFRYMFFYICEFHNFQWGPDPLIPPPLPFPRCAQRYTCIILVIWIQFLSDLEFVNIRTMSNGLMDSVSTYAK